MEFEFTGDDGAGASNYSCHIRCFSAPELELRDLKLASRAICPGYKTEPATAASMADGRKNAA